MLSDIHLDPFHDPAKVAQLRSAPASGWLAILDTAPSPTQAADYAKLQSTCGAKGVDTPVRLLESSLHAEHAQQPAPLFITVSGDLMAHQFDCRFHTLAPGATAADLSAFAAKTVAFIALRLHQTFPHSPIYFALGNNDSGCADYRETPDSAFLHSDAETFAAGALAKSNSDGILRDFPRFGDYNIALPAPFTHTRLLVLQDIFESKHYSSCGGAGDPGANAGALQVEWLLTQLAAARAIHEQVWIMAHIPPGVDPYSTIRSSRGNVCTGNAPDFFIPSAQFADTLSQYADVIKLALFGHTHMDEMRAFPSTALGSDGHPTAFVPAKLVPSITPINGNNPSFTVAQVNPATATLVDYTVYSAGDKTGADLRWPEEYRYATTYHLPDFSGESAAKLTSAMIADKSGSSDASQAYQRFYFVGGVSLSANLKAAAMQLVWPAYACALANPTTPTYRTCTCPASPTAPAAPPSN